MCPGNVCLVAEASVILYHKVICHYALAFCMVLVFRSPSAAFWGFFLHINFSTSGFFIFLEQSLSLLITFGAIFFFIHYPSSDHSFLYQQFSFSHCALNRFWVESQVQCDNFQSFFWADISASLFLLSFLKDGKAAHIYLYTISLQPQQIMCHLG